MHLSNVVFLVFSKVVVSCSSYDFGIRASGDLPRTADAPEYNDVAFVDRKANP